MNKDKTLGNELDFLPYQDVIDQVAEDLKTKYNDGRNEEPSKLVYTIQYALKAKGALEFNAEAFEELKECAKADYHAYLALKEIATNSLAHRETIPSEIRDFLSDVLRDEFPAPSKNKPKHEAKYFRLAYAAWVMKDRTNLSMNKNEASLNKICAYDLVVEAARRAGWPAITFNMVREAHRKHSWMFNLDNC